VTLVELSGRVQHTTRAGDNVLLFFNLLFNLLFFSLFFLIIIYYYLIIIIFYVFIFLSRVWTMTSVITSHTRSSYETLNLRWENNQNIIYMISL